MAYLYDITMGITVFNSKMFIELSSKMILKSYFQSQVKSVQTHMYILFTPRLKKVKLK